jgi:hypothetical protein
VVVPFIPSPVRASPAVPGFEAPEKRFPGGPIIFGAQLQSEAPAGLAFQARKLWDPDVLHRARPSPPDLAPAALAPRSPLHAGSSSFCCSRPSTACSRSGASCCELPAPPRRRRLLPPSRHHPVARFAPPLRAFRARVQIASSTRPLATSPPGATLTRGARLSASV